MTLASRKVSKNSVIARTFETEWDAPIGVYVVVFATQETNNKEKTGRAISLVVVRSTMQDDEDDHWCCLTCAA